MEASQTTGADAPVDTGTQDEGGQEQQQGLDLAPLEQRMDEFTGRFGEALDRLEQRLPEPDQQGYDPAQEEMQQNFESLYDPTTGEPDPQQAERLLQQMIDQRASQAVGPVMQEIQAMRVERDAERLEQQYPDLQDPANAKAALDAAQEAAVQMGKPELAQSPALVEMAYLASQARERAAAEPAAGASGNDLESGGGAAPSEEEDDPAQRIVDAGRPKNFWTGG